MFFFFLKKKILQRRFTGGQDYTIQNGQTRQIGQGEKPPQFSNIPSSATVKAGESAIFTAKVSRARRKMKSNKIEKFISDF